jgi:hypothetical protein
MECTIHSVVNVVESGTTYVSGLIIVSRSSFYALLIVLVR